MCAIFIAAFGQSSTNTNPFSQNSFRGFGQATPAANNNNPFAPKPFGSPTTAFWAQTGGLPFGTASTGAFGQKQPTPTFGTTSTGAFGQQQSTFGTPSSSPFGSTPVFGTSPTPAFGAISSTFGSGMHIFADSLLMCGFAMLIVLDFQSSKALTLKTSPSIIAVFPMSCNISLFFSFVSGTAFYNCCRANQAKLSQFMDQLFFRSTLS
jgi:hypothetical protein